jgi:hypothetical protein
MDPKDGLVLEVPLPSDWPLINSSRTELYRVFRKAVQEFIFSCLLIFIFNLSFSVEMRYLRTEIDDHMQNLVNHVDRMTGYPIRFHSTNQKDTETEADLEKDGMSSYAKS